MTLAKNVRCWLGIGFIAVGLLASLPALAQTTAANGGEVLRCSSSSSAQLFDFFEGERLAGEVPHITGSDIHERVRSLIDRFQQTDPSRRARYASWFADFQREARFVDGVQLTPPIDADLSIVPADCEVIPVAMLTDPAAGEPRYIIRRDLWDAMDEINRAGLIMHLLIYREGRAQLNHMDSRFARRLLSFIASRPHVSLRDYADAISKYKFVVEDEFNLLEKAQVWTQQIATFASIHDLDEYYPHGVLSLGNSGVFVVSPCPESRCPTHPWTRTILTRYDGEGLFVWDKIVDRPRSPYVRLQGTDDLVAIYPDAGACVLARLDGATGTALWETRVACSTATRGRGIVVAQRDIGIFYESADAFGRYAADGSELWVRDRSDLDVYYIDSIGASYLWSFDHYQKITPLGDEEWSLSLRDHGVMGVLPGESGFALVDYRETGIGVTWFDTDGVEYDFSTFDESEEDLFLQTQQSLVLSEGEAVIRADNKSPSSQERLTRISADDGVVWSRMIPREGAIWGMWALDQDHRHHIIVGNALYEIHHGQKIGSWDVQIVDSLTLTRLSRDQEGVYILAFEEDPADGRVAMLLRKLVY